MSSTNLELETKIGKTVTQNVKDLPFWSIQSKLQLKDHGLNRGDRELSLNDSFCRSLLNNSE